MEANEIKLSTLVISVLGIAAIELAARVLISRNFLAPMSGVGLARVAEMFFLLALIKFREKRLSIIGLASTTVYKGFKRGLIWSISFGAGAAIVLFIIYLAGIKISALFGMRLPTESSRLIAFLLAGLLVGPIAEEIFFRGILYGFFRRWGIPFAVILSTLLFVLPHAPSSGPAIPVTQLIGGILFAVSYEIEKNLLVPITIHSLGNLAIFTLAQMI
ncbi:MAG: CPBP family intramembrane metalloprotease [Desulfobacterales bacterium]|nr:CPBP family intramembrane metalloprotease [Desulfobacterales bacterium]